MLSSMNIRFASPADFDQWLPLWQAYNRFYGRSGLTALPDQITQSTWDRFHDPHEPMHCIVAESGGQLAGLVHFIFHRTTISIAPTCYLQDLFTRDTERGKGVGGMLIEAVYEQARLAGSARVYWLTHETNTTAMKLYDRLAVRSGFLQYRKILE
jgi:GNAT superfamily N-acetyltransferase